MQLFLVMSWFAQNLVEYNCCVSFLFSIYTVVKTNSLRGAHHIYRHIYTHYTISSKKVQEGKDQEKAQSRGAIRKRPPLQKPRWEKTKLKIRYIYHENIS